MKKKVKKMIFFFSRFYEKKNFFSLTRYQTTLLMSLSVRILETPPPHLEHRFSGFIFANFMELIKLREQDDKEDAKRIQTRAIRQRLENKSKGQLMLEDFRYWALKYVFEFLCHIEFDIEEGICYYESARVEVYMACGVTVRTQQVDLRQPALQALALPLLTNNNVMRVNEVLQITGLQLAAELREALPCRIVHAGYEDDSEVREFSLRDIELAENVVAAQILEDADEDLPQLEGMRPIQATGICRLLIPHMYPEFEDEFDEDHNQFQYAILEHIIFDNRDEDAPELEEVLLARVEFFEDLVEDADPPSDDLRRLLSRELHVLSVLHRRHGLLEEARTTQQRQLDIWRALDDEDGAASVLCCLGNTLNDMEKYEEGRDILQEALVLFERLHGVDSNSVARTLNNLSEAQSELQQLQEARTSAERALRIMETHFYEEDPDLYSTVLFRNSQILLEIGGAANLNRALTLVEQGIAIEIREFGVAQEAATDLLADIEEKRRE